MERGHPNTGFVSRAHKFLIWFGAAYVAILVLLAIPPIQRQLVYVHLLRVPLWADFDTPEKYGFAPFKATNVKIQTPDAVELGAWFVLSDSIYRAQPRPRTAPPTQQDLRAALQARPTILYFHGNAGTRAARTRVEHARTFSSRLDANVLAIDYRGFADSTGAPSEAGLVLDARAAFEWLTSRGASPEDIVLVGTSLGTGVAVQAAAGLLADGVRPRGVALLAPFSSLATLLDTYYILGLVPLLKPLGIFPPVVAKTFKTLLRERFDSLAHVPRLDTTVFVAHAEDDWDIPHLHSRTLFGAFVDAVEEKAKEGTGMEDAVPGEEERAGEPGVATWAEKGRVERRVEGLGVVETLDRSVEGKGPVVFVTSPFGGHERVGIQEAVQDEMAAAFSLW